MIEPSEQTIRELLLSIYCEGVPRWTTSQQQEAYAQLVNLYEYWFRKEVKCVQ